MANELLASLVWDLLKEKSRNKGTVTPRHYIDAANFRKRSVPEVRGMEEVAMKLIFSGVNSIMVYVHVMTTEPCDSLCHLRGFSAPARCRNGNRLAV
jgi:hypothetical protein